MPRIKEVKVSPFNSTQDIPEDRVMSISRCPSRDLEKALGEDYHIDPSGDTSTSDFFHMVEAGAPLTAAAMFTGATECAHIDAVRCAHVFNGTMVEHWPNAYKMPDWDRWVAYHEENGRQCPSCETFNYDTRPGWTCGNCLGTLGYMKGDEAEYEDSTTGDYKYSDVVSFTWDSETRSVAIQWLTLENGDVVRSDYLLNTYIEED